MIGETSADKAAAPAKAVRIPKRKAPSTADARLDHTDGAPAKASSAPVSAKMEAFLRGKPCKPLAQRKAELGIPVDY